MKTRAQLYLDHVNSRTTRYNEISIMGKGSLGKRRKTEEERLLTQTAAQELSFTEETAHGR